MLLHRADDARVENTEARRLAAPSRESTGAKGRPLEWTPAVVGGETTRFSNVGFRFLRSCDSTLHKYPTVGNRSHVSTTYQLDTRSIPYAIAARTGSDHRPILRWLRGLAPLPRGATGERIALVAAELGVGPQLPFGQGDTTRKAPETDAPRGKESSDTVSR